MKKRFILVALLLILLTACETNLYFPYGKTCSLLYNGAYYEIESVKFESTADGTPLELRFVKAKTWGKEIVVSWDSLRSGTSAISNIGDFKACIDLIPEKDLVVTGTDKQRVLDALDGYFSQIPVQTTVYGNSGYSNPATQPHPLAVPTNAPVVTTQDYVLQTSDGREIPVPDIEHAKQQFDAGVVYLRQLVNGIESSRTPVESLADFTPPNGPDGQPINLANANSPYYKDESTGIAYVLQEDAVADAETRPNATNIGLYVRGEHQGVAQSIPAFDLRLTDENGFTNVVTPNEFYWVFLPGDGGPPQNFKSLSEAEESAKSYGANGKFPGGDVTPFKRGKPQVADDNGSFAFKVPAWECPSNFMQCRADQQYYVYNNAAFDSKSSAISATDGRWWFGVNKQPIEEFKRGEHLNTMVNWWVPWQWIIAMALVLVFVARFFNQHKDVFKEEFSRYKLPSKSPHSVRERAKLEAKRSLVRAALNLVLTSIWLSIVTAVVLAIGTIARLINEVGNTGDPSLLVILVLIVMIAYWLDSLVNKFKQKILKNHSHERKVQ